MSKSANGEGYCRRIDTNKYECTIMSRYINPKTGKEKLFKLYKFRSMTNAKDENGNWNAHTATWDNFTNMNVQTMDIVYLND